MPMLCILFFYVKRKHSLQLHTNLIFMYQAKYNIHKMKNDLQDKLAYKLQELQNCCWKEKNNNFACNAIIVLVM